MADTTTPFAPVQASMAAATLVNATTTSGTTRVALPGGGRQFRVRNRGVVDVNFTFGDSAATATTNSMSIGPGVSESFTASNSETHVAAITASGTATLEITAGSGA